ncbi:MAG TPA: Spx/MgsR family RNA polymerase-binding regulatory protein [Rhizobiales bacterium]|nr:Spx/MgsR family RNA polymerase-binding regulatory protein [Hyphomicrobiales bacterium]
MLTVYTLKSCDTCRKALKWLDANNIKATVFDIRTDGISQDVLAEAIDHLGWEKVLNRRSTTWRNLDEHHKQDITAQKATTLIAQNPTLMKRPLFVSGNSFVAGFDKPAQAWLSQLTF